MKGPSILSRRSALLGVASLVLIVFVGLSWHQWEHYRTANADAQRSRQTLTAIHTVLATLLNAETGQRGFLLTGEDRYLDPYNRALQELPAALANLKGLVSGSQAESQDFDHLNTLAHTKLDELRRTIDARRTQGVQAALALVLTNEGQRTMDAIRVLCARMEANENDRQAQASAGEDAAAGTALLITVGGSLLLLFLFAFGFQPFASPDLHARQRSWPVRYGAAILAVVAITLIRAALSPLIGDGAMPFTMYFCAVAFAAWFGGLRPAVLSIALSLFAGAWFFAPPRHSLFVSGHDDQTAMFLLVLVGFGFALLSRSQLAAVDRALRAESSERTERRRFQTTLASIGDAVIATDASGCIVFINRVASALLKWPQNEARGRALHDVFRIVHEHTRVPVESPVLRVLREGQIVGLANHTVLIARDGSEIPIDDSAAPILDRDGNIQGAVLVFRDVTARRHTEHQLAQQAALLEEAVAEARAQRQRLGLALTAGKMGVFELNPAENIFWWSPETYSLFGVTPSDFHPSRDSFAALIHPADRQPFMQYWDENVAGFQPINHEFRILRPAAKATGRDPAKDAAKERWISCRGTPKYDDAGLPTHVSGLFLDITERKGAEQMLRKFERLSAAARLSSAIAHEINNPLSSVTNLIYLAKTSPGVPAPVLQQLAQAEQELERVAHAARQALGFYRESSSAERIDVPDLIDSILRIFSNRIAEKNIRIVRAFPKCPPVFGMRGEIRQALSNLLVNAIEAVKDGGVISLAARPLDAAGQQALEIIIGDDGHGIPPDHLDHIFEPFFTTKAGTGTGLGLWVTREIVERHRGSIAVQSDNSSATRGATFTVTLPAEPGSRTAPSPLDPPQSSPLDPTLRPTPNPTNPD